MKTKPKRELSPLGRPLSSTTAVSVNVPFSPANPAVFYHLFIRKIQDANAR
jgi:hypothetical protein